MPYKPANRLIYLLRQAGFECTTRTKWGVLIPENIRIEGHVIVTRYRDNAGFMQWFKDAPRVELN